MADALMQGNQTERSVLHALDILEKLKVELVIIIRGGGSKTDLFYLDNEAIARKIAGYKLPVWSGIGHEIDTSVLDHVANKYFKTPTAVAEEIIARYVDMNRHLEEAKSRFQSTWTYRLDREKKYISDARTGIIQGTRKLLDFNSGNLKNMANLLSSKVKDRLILEKSMLSASMKLLTTAPVNLIQRVQDRLKDKTYRFKNGCGRQVLEGKQTLEYLMKRFQPEKFNQRIIQEWRNLNSWKGVLTRKVTADFNTRYREIDYLKNRFRKEAILTRIENERKSLNNKSATLKASDPGTSLKRGFSLVYSEGGGLIKSVAEINQNDVLRTKMSDGQVTSTVNDIERK
jgi:exodeoxyribonuclease VII large subunit